MIKKMKKQGYVESFTNPTDSRKQVVRLTRKAAIELPYFEKIWEAGELGIEKMIPSDSTLMEELKMVELKLGEKDFMERTLNEFKNNG